MVQSCLKFSQRRTIKFSALRNHARGAKFIDGSHWITPKLTQTINEMCCKFRFYFGRLDVMYNVEELEQGINFSIVELNGAEPNTYL
jgi:hypothetical protein